MTDKRTATQPIEQEPFGVQPHLTVAATYQDPRTKALYVHQDLRKAQEPWSEEEHVSPTSAKESFGDVESFVAYVCRYGDVATTFLGWSSGGLKAVLDYRNSETDEPGRGQWIALLPFTESLQWRTWRAFANGSAWPQKSVVEKLEDLAADIVSPVQADLLTLLRGLRGSVSAKADVELRPDGTSKVAFERDSTVKTANALELPSSFAIAIPVLKGHVDDEGRPVVYRLDVRLRVSLDSEAKLTLRLTLPNAERVLEDVYLERVTAAKELFGEGFTLLRASD